MSRSVVLILLILLANYKIQAMPTSPEYYTATLPLTCAELLPDTTPYITFFEAVGRGQITKDRRTSKRVYKILALRERMLDVIEKGKDENPIDTLIRKTLCFYREQREPLKPIGFDDSKFLSYLTSSLKDLESKVENAVFQWEIERQRRKEFERMALRNQKRVDALVREADVEADQLFEKLSQRARKKVSTQ